MNFGDFTDGGTPASGDYMVGYASGGGAGSDRRWNMENVARSINSFNVKNYGAVGNGTTNDLTAINSAITAAHAAGGGIVNFPEGSFAVNNYILEQYDNIWLRGSGKGITKIKLLNSVSEDIVKFFSGGQSNCGISDLTIDAGNFVVAGHGAVNLNTVTAGGFCRRVSVINMGQFGITVQGSDRFDISDNDVTLNTAINTQNHGILASESTQNTNGIFARNTCVNTNMELDGRYFLVENNNVSGWKYGGGITMGPSSKTHDCTIRGNICHGGIGIDSDTTYVPGLEIWSIRSVIEGNICFSNSGHGIMVGGKNSTVTGNVCYDNGQQGHAGDQSGIFAQQSDATFNASGSIIVGNRCFNLLGVTQEYGFSHNASVTDLVVGLNDFAGNNTQTETYANQVNDAGASGAGVAVGSLYRNGSILMLRVA